MAMTMKDRFRWEIARAIRTRRPPEPYTALGRYLDGKPDTIALDLFLPLAERRDLADIRRWHRAGCVIAPASTPADARTVSREPVTGDVCRGCGGQMIAPGVLCLGCAEMRELGLALARLTPERRRQVLSKYEAAV